MIDGSVESANRVFENDRGYVKTMKMRVVSIGYVGSGNAQ